MHVKCHSYMLKWFRCSDEDPFFFRPQIVQLCIVHVKSRGIRKGQRVCDCKGPPASFTDTATAAKLFYHRAVTSITGCHRATGLNYIMNTARCQWTVDCLHTQDLLFSFSSYVILLSVLFIGHTISSVPAVLFEADRKQHDTHIHLLV